MKKSIYWRMLLSYLLIIAVTTATIWLAGQSFAPIFLDHHVNSMVQTMHNITPSDVETNMTSDLELGYKRALSQSLLWAIILAVIGASAVAFYVTRRLVLPLKDLQTASLRIARGNYHERLKNSAPGEIQGVVEAFNAMTTSLESSEDRRVELLSNVAHEFRTPLSNLNGYVEGLEDGVFELNQDTVAACKRQINRLERLVDDLSLLSRVETGQEVFSPEKLSATKLFTQTCANFKPQFIKKGVRLSWESPLELWLIADKKRLEQVLTNLVGNALRHTPEGGEVLLSAIATEPNKVLMRIKDTGEGISIQDLPHIFTRFYRGDKARVKDGNVGSGIGLTIAKHYIEQQGGEIGVNSEPGKETEFWFSLPRSQS